MKKTFIFLILIITTILGCKSDSDKERELLEKENQLLKKELELEKRENALEFEDKKSISNESIQKNNENLSKAKNTIKSDIIEFKKLFSGDITTVQLNTKGDFSFDMGSASAGRVSGNLRSVEIIMEHIPERPGCADICPEMILIRFECKNDKNCVTDPAFSNTYYDSGAISITNIELGRESYRLLRKIADQID